MEQTDQTKRGSTSENISGKTKLRRTQLKRQVYNQFSKFNALHYEIFCVIFSKRTELCNQVYEQKKKVQNLFGNVSLLQKVPNLRRKKTQNKIKHFLITAEIPKAQYCSVFCFLLTIDVCIINLWSFKEILPILIYFLLFQVNYLCEVPVNS